MIGSRPAPAETSAPRPQAMRRLPPTLLVALSVRYLGWVVMMALALYGEGRAAPHLPDLVIDRLPYVAWVDRYNHYILAAAYLPLSLGLLAVAPAHFCRYNVSAGLLSIARGLCIAATGLGPVRGDDVHANLFAGPQGRQAYWAALWDLCSPLGLLLQRRGSPVHEQGSVLLGPYRSDVPAFAVRLAVPPAALADADWAPGGRRQRLSSHLHYTIDVIGAYAIAYALYTLRERRTTPT